MEPITVIRPTAEEMMKFITDELLPYGKVIVSKLMKMQNKEEMWLMKFNVDVSK